MVNNEVLHKIFRAFPHGNINQQLEFIAEPRVNSYFRLEDCITEKDVIKKVLEYLSRDAFKSQHYSTDKANKKVWDYHLNGINSFTGQNFTKDDIEIIYTKLGNGINSPLANEFIKSGYDMNVLSREIDT